ncbi:MAG TPA: hypothetical protein VF038_06120, partial [Usitatibacter sp.]
MTDARASRGGPLAIAAAGAAAIVVDALVFRAMHPPAAAAGGALFAAGLASAAALAAVLAALDSRLRAVAPARLATAALGAVLVLFLRGGLFASLVDVFHAGTGTAHAVAAIGTAAALVAGALWLREPAADEGVRWDRFCAAAIACAVLLRLLYLGVPELIFEEAYYWNYAQH